MPEVKLLGGLDIVVSKITVLGLRLGGAAEPSMFSQMDSNVKGERLAAGRLGDVWIT